MFDETFLNATTTETTSTEYATIPEQEYMAVIERLETRNPKQSSILDVFWRLDAPDIEEANGKIVRQSLFLDLSSEGALLTGKGKNVKLGYLRTALNQNAEGVPWSPTMMIGNVARVKLENRSYEGKLFPDITAVTLP